MKSFVLLLLSTVISFSQASNDPLGEKADGFNDSPKKLDGVWLRDDKGWFSLKHYAFGQFGVSNIDRATGVITAHRVGYFSDDGANLIEWAKFTTVNQQEFFCGRKITYRTGFAGDGVFAQQSGGDKQVWMKKGGDEKTLDDVADFSAKRTKLDGVWIRKSSNKHGPFTAMKVYDHGRFSETHFRPTDKTVTIHVIGIYSFGDGVAKFRILHATNNLKASIGQTRVARILVNKSEMTQTGTSGDSEKWTKAMPASD